MGIDFRAVHKNFDGLQLKEESFYVMDNTRLLPPTRHLKPKQRKMLKDRVKEIRMELNEALGGKAQISIKRWLPGVQKNEDCDAAHTRRPSAEHDPQDAFKQAHPIMSNAEKQQQTDLLAAEAGTKNDDTDDSTTNRQKELEL